MDTLTIQRQYDEVVAPHYDLDPQDVIGRSLDLAVAQIQKSVLNNGSGRLKVLDVGVGTGRFIAKLKALDWPIIQPFGLDLSEKMIAAARQRIPDLVATVDDAVNLDARFPQESFDLICTHFITGYVPTQVLAPKIWRRLAEGGYWSVVGGTKAGFPALQAKANSKLLRWFCGGGQFSVDDIVCNPADREELVQILEGNGFAPRHAQTFRPGLRFADYDEFMNFAYRGGWLTPFVETLGLHNAGPLTRTLMNLFFFPATDHHSIEVVLAQKVSGQKSEVNNPRSEISALASDF
jgi:SAM-dependent methyltransferase